MESVIKHKYTIEQHPEHIYPYWLSDGETRVGDYATLAKAEQVLRSLVNPEPVRYYDAEGRYIED